MKDSLNGWEKAALLTNGAGGSFNILLFQLGATLAHATTGPLWGWRVVFAWLSFIGYDLTIFVTVMAMRSNRRSPWALATVVVAMLSAILIAVDVSMVRMPWLHAAPVVVLSLFALHLAAPRERRSRDELGMLLAQAETDVAQLQNELAQTQQEAARLRHGGETTMAQHASRAAQLENALARREDELARVRQLLEQRDGDLAQLTTSIGGRSYTLAQLQQALGVAPSTAARKLKAIDETR